MYKEGPALQYINLHCRSGFPDKVNYIRACRLLGGQNITANLYCICLSEHETYAYTDAVNIYGNICNAQYVLLHWIMLLIIGLTHYNCNSIWSYWFINQSVGPLFLIKKISTFIILYLFKGIILLSGTDRKSVSNPPSWIFQVEIYNKQLEKHQVSWQHYNITVRFCTVFFF